MAKYRNRWNREINICEIFDIRKGDSSQGRLKTAPVKVNLYATCLPFFSCLKKGLQWFPWPWKAGKNKQNKRTQINKSTHGDSEKNSSKGKYMNNHEQSLPSLLSWAMGNKALFFGEIPQNISKTTIDLHCLIPRKWVPCNDHCWWWQH